VIRRLPGRPDLSAGRRRVLPAWIISVVVNALVLGLFTLTVALGSSRAGTPAIDTAVETPVEISEESDPPIVPDIGTNLALPPSAGSDRIEPVDVFERTNPDQILGVRGGQEHLPANIAPAPGFGDLGSGVGLDNGRCGTAPMSGLPGGGGGSSFASRFPGDSGGNREKLALTNGGSRASEAAVAEGLLWLARHQSPDGRWSLDRFNRDVNLKFPEDGRVANDGSTGQGINNDIAGTALGLLPFLGAGETHRPPPAGTRKAVNYQKVVTAGLRYLLAQQTPDGEFPGGMYAHGLATIAVCEAYGMTSDPQLKRPAQKAVDFIVKAQNPTTGGWRYAPRTDGDTSVLGWQVMALKSGQMAGLSVPRPTLELAGKWLDSCATADRGGYGYTSNQETPTMTAVGLLCRMYLGWSPKNPGIQAGVNRLRKLPPPPEAGSLPSMYHYYYAAQVMHQFGGDAWEAWNPKLRDGLVRTQEHGNDPRHRGSWDPAPDVLGKPGGRVMTTSLALLTLEVYYRHLPLYRRDGAVMK
jgi:hypothetical protein